MIYTKMTQATLNLYFEAHKNQRDKSGMPYVFHPFHLAEQMKDEKITIVALLHDVVGDTDVTLYDIRNMGFDDEVVAAIGLMHDAELTEFLEWIMYEVKFKKWFFGHWHTDEEFDERFRALWFDVETIRKQN